MQDPQASWSDSGQPQPWSRAKTGKLLLTAAIAIVVGMQATDLIGAAWRACFEVEPGTNFGLGVIYLPTTVGLALGSYPPDMTRGQRGRAWARAELVFAGVVGFVIAPFLYVAAPATMGPQPPEWQTLATLGVAAGGILTGFIWMIRIYRGDPEPDQRAWRYRDRG